MILIMICCPHIGLLYFIVLYGGSISLSGATAPFYYHKNPPGDRRGSGRLDVAEAAAGKIPSCISGVLPVKKFKDFLTNISIYLNFT